MTERSPFRYFKTSPEIIRLAVMRVKLSKVERLTESVTLYEFSHPDGSPMKCW
jgi:hypothetical protein